MAKFDIFILQAVAAATGIVLDPVYSGKALHGLMRDIAAAPKEWAGRRLLFVHTGGLLVRTWVGEHSGTGCLFALWENDGVNGQGYMRVSFSVCGIAWRAA